MSNSKRILDNKTKKQKSERIKKVKQNLDDLDDAIVDGVLVASVKDRVFFERTINKVTKTHVGHIQAFSGDVIDIWDETISQFYSVSLSGILPKIKKALFGKKLSNRFNMNEITLIW